MGEKSRPAPATAGGRARERGSAVVEFVFLGVVLLIPVVYLIITASQLQAASYAAVGAADHAAKVFVAARSEGAGSASARDAVERAVGNMGLGAGSATMEYRCSGPCLDPGTTVTVRVSVAIGLPLMPPGMGEGIGTASSESTSRVDRFG
ncbi:hypothetical protein ACX8Z9_00075 [Arthrobacter halodurans]|uniref:TadE-like protein n=1 Tax=Arthrobacter halodurans TaxID=516699 RepID=A0ABV4UIF8_9MICC